MSSTALSELSELPVSPVVERFEAARGVQRRRQLLRHSLFGALFVVVFVGAANIAEVSPAAFVDGLPNSFDYIYQTLPRLHWTTLGADLATWYWGLGKWLVMLFDTVVIGFLGTVLGTAGAFLLSFAASRNLVGTGPLHFLLRRWFDLARTVPELVFALIFVFAFGLGALPGVIAIAVHTFGALGKLFAEVVENVDSKPIDGLRSTGANWFQTVRYAVVPQVLPNFASYALLRFEINVRSAAIIGFVGAGGIGIELYTVVRQFVFTDVSALVLLLVLTVVLIDLGCEALRHRLIGKESMA